MSPFTALLVMASSMVLVAAVAILAEHYQWGKRMRAASVKRQIAGQALYLAQLQSSNEQYPGVYDIDVAREEHKLQLMLDSLK